MGIKLCMNCKVNEGIRSEMKFVRYFSQKIGDRQFSYAEFLCITCNLIVNFRNEE